MDNAGKTLLCKTAKCGCWETNKKKLASCRATDSSVASAENSLIPEHSYPEYLWNAHNSDLQSPCQVTDASHPGTPVEAERVSLSVLACVAFCRPLNKAMGLHIYWPRAVSGNACYCCLQHVKSSTAGQSSPCPLPCGGPVTCHEALDGTGSFPFLSVHPPTPGRKLAWMSLFSEWMSSGFRTWHPCRLGKKNHVKGSGLTLEWHSSTFARQARVQVGAHCGVCPIFLLLKLAWSHHLGTR